MYHLDQTPGRTAWINGKEHLFFSGYNYLGMHQVPGFIALVKEGIDRYGWLFPSSRISNTRLDIFDEMEAMLSNITGHEATVLFSSGFLAGRAVASLFDATEIAAASHTHPALSLSINGNNNHLTLQNNDKSVLFFDAVNPLQATCMDLSFLNSIQYPITCIADDSHGIGLLNNGSGISTQIVKKTHINFAVTYSLSKAFHLAGGAVSGSAAMATLLRQTPFYTASTSISPALAYAFINGQEYYADQRKKLQENIQYFRELTKDKYTSNNALPIFILPPGTDTDRLTLAGIIISSFAYPDPTGETIHRIIINALHTQQDLETVAALL